MEEEDKKYTIVEGFSELPTDIRPAYIKFKCYRCDYSWGVHIWPGGVLTRLDMTCSRCSSNNEYAKRKNNGYYQGGLKNGKRI